LGRRGVFVIGIVLGLLAGGIVATIISSTFTKPVTHHIIITAYNTVTSLVTKTTFITVSPNSTAHPQTSSCVIFEALKAVFKRSEPVAFRLINDCDEDVVLPNSAPWIVKNCNGETIFSPISLQVITKIEPGGSKEWLWNQRDTDGKNVEPGIYYIVLDTMNKGSLVIEIEIQ